MNDYYILLNTSINPLIDGIDVTTQKVKHTLLSLDTINPKMLEWLDSLGLKVPLVEVFNWPKGAQGGIHIDGYNEGNYTKFNFVYGGAGSITRWFEKIDTDYAGANHTTTVKTPALIYEPNKVNVIRQQHIEGPYILQAGIPHQVVNGNIEGRWTLSFVLSKKAGTPLSMNEAQNLFNPYLR